LPKRQSAIGTIHFDGGTINRNIRFRLYDCSRSVNNLSAICENQNVTFSAWGHRTEGQITMTGGTKIKDILVLVLPHPPFVIKTETGWDGYCVEVFKLVADRLNLTYQFVEQLDGKYGSPLPGGYWDGIVGSIIEKKAKVGIGPIIANSEAREVVDFTRPYLPSSGILILMRRTRENMVAPLFFIYLFSEYVWIVCGVLILVIASGAWACELISPYQPKTDRDPVSFVKRVSFCRLFDMVSFVTASWAGQGDSFNPHSPCAKFLTVGHWVFIVLMLSLLGSNFSAELAVKGSNYATDTVQELVTEESIRYTVESNSFAQMFFDQMGTSEAMLFETWREKATTFTKWSGANSLWLYPMDEKHLTVNKRIAKWGTVNSSDELVALVRQGWIGFVGDLTAQFYIRKSCDLITVGSRLSDWEYGMVLQRNSELTPQFDMRLADLRASGALAIIFDRWWPYTSEDCSLTIDSGLSLVELSGTFYLMAVGIGGSIVILLIEIAIHHSHKNVTKNRSSTKDTEREKTTEKRPSLKTTIPKSRAPTSTPSKIPRPSKNVLNRQLSF
ncbi:hypothetical protein FGIG_10773, partial [Fasciola gigantica]